MRTILSKKKINTKRNKCISKLCIFRQKLSSKVFFLFYSSHPWRYSLFLWSNFVQYFNLSSVEMANLFIKFHNLSSSVLTARRKNIEWTFFENKLFQFQILLFFLYNLFKSQMRLNLNNLVCVFIFIKYVVKFSRGS